MLPGDFNHDGAARAADYVVWRKNPGGVYTQNDYNTSRAHFGQTAGSGSGITAWAPSGSSGAIPEPGSLELLLLATAGLFVTPYCRVVVKNRC